MPLIPGLRFSSPGMIMENILEYHNQYSDDVISMGKGLKLQKCRDFVVAWSKIIRLLL